MLPLMVFLPYATTTKKKAKTKNHHQQQSDTKTNQKNSIKPTQEKNNVPRLSYAQL